MRKLLYTIIFLYSTSLFAQRKSMSVIVIDDERQYITAMKEQGIESRFKYSLPNNIDFNPLNSEIKYIGEKITQYEVSSLLNRHNVGNQLLSFWWNRGNDGMFSTKTVGQRGKYNASDNDVKLSQNSSRGLTMVEDAGERLIEHSYLTIIKVNEIITTDEYYDRKDKKAEKAKSIVSGAVKILGALTKTQDKVSTESIDNYKTPRTQRGYVANGQVFTYRFKYDETVKNEFYKMWLYENDDYAVRNQKIKAFENHNFEFDFVSEKEFDSFSGTQNVELRKNEEFLSDDELYDRLMKFLPSSAINEAEQKNKDVYAAQESGIYSTSPLSAKVGSKDNVYKGDRFFVYEKIQTKSGSTKERYAGAIRAMSDNYNQDAETGNSGTTRFRKIHGFKTIEPGMAILKKKDIDLSIFISNSPEDINGNGIYSFGVSGSFDTRLRFGVGFNVMGGDIPSNYDIELNSMFEFFTTVESPIYIGSLYLSPRVGFGLSNVSVVRSFTNSLKTYSIPLGLEFGYNIRPSIGIFANLSKNAVNLPTLYDDGDKEEKLMDDRGNSINWFDLSPSFNSTRLNYGLRINF
jgi:hypothetical protein